MTQFRLRVFTEPELIVCAGGLVMFTPPAAVKAMTVVFGFLSGVFLQLSPELPLKDDAVV
ncbi:MAG: hypothetical protein IPP52_09405 [Ignavibacteria bacterium]|nr:hypothetical protein [Ignavibacteria bacterium]